MINEENVKFYKEKRSILENYQQYLKLIQTIFLIGIFIFLVLIWQKLPSNSSDWTHTNTLSKEPLNRTQKSGFPKIIDVRVVNTPTVDLLQDLSFDNFDVNVTNFSDLIPFLVSPNIADGVEDGLKSFCRSTAIFTSYALPVKFYKD